MRDTGVAPSEKGGLLGRRACRPAGPGPDEGDTGNRIFRCRHLGSDPFQESIQITQTLERKIELPDLRQQSAKKIVDPARRGGIIPQWNFQLQIWCRQPGLLEDAVEGEAHLRIPAGALERLANERCARSPKGQVRTERENGGPGGLLKG